MDELRGPNIQIVLHVKEGLGFGFLRTPFVVSGSLNGYMLETDPVVPTHAPIFDAELVWEADKRRFRSLRVQNVPVKVEVYTTSTQGRKDKVGYLLLSLLGAQPCPSNKVIDIKHTWQRLLGVKSEGKCCHPQLLLSLSVEDRANTPTPRNELRMFHSNEVAYPSTYPTSTSVTGKSVLLTLNEYIEESKKTVTSPDLQPILMCDEGLIQIGSGRHLFVLSLVIGAVENLDLLLPSSISNKNVYCYITYSVFTHNIMTDRVGASVGSGRTSAQFNQRSSLRLRGSLPDLGRYFAECPHLVTKVCAGDINIGICSLDLRKLVPTDDTNDFLNKFCNAERALTIHERCFILRCEGVAREEGRRPFVDVEMSLKYVGLQDKEKPKNLTARSATQLDSNVQREPVHQDPTIDYKSGSCTDLDPNVGGVAYTSVAARNTARYKDASGESIIKSNEIAELIKKMCDSFAQSQERLLASRSRPLTSDMQVQCEPIQQDSHVNQKEDTKVEELTREVIDNTAENNIENRPSENIKLETSKSDACTSQTEKVKLLISPTDRDAIMQGFVDELEDWKEKQQELYKCQLKRKEEYHLELLAKEWAKKRVELECKLSRGIEQCRTLAADLARASDDFRLRGYRNVDREKKLLEAKKALEAHYTAKYQELREASQKMEDDMNHQLKLKDMRIEELELKVKQLDKHVEVLKTNLKNCEKDAENRYSGLTKDQTASLIQELRCLEEKLDSAVQSKAFFKEQWGRAVRELHLSKLHARKHVLTQLQSHRRELGDMGLDTIQDQEEDKTNQNNVDIKKLKDDFLVDILANTPALESHSIISDSIPDGMDIFKSMKSAPRNPINDKLNDLMAQRDRLIQQENPDEDHIKQLNYEIRSMLLNSGT
ncbi:centrosomal protein of 120 kDa-like isoform X2 [Galleria mellonella]|uniref:Centrosomal protein of 120 kDa-like isoform X2 n=1 Tax=Galleria mellonella TaxID=7137 RepID=A0ABM3N4Q7_GALME|nr:centrosomal protein of 120 kDa-like isoform X2 [Galleria mellonella]